MVHSAFLHQPIHSSNHQPTRAAISCQSWLMPPHPTTPICTPSATPRVQRASRSPRARQTSHNPSGTAHFSPGRNRCSPCRPHPVIWQGNEVPHTVPRGSSIRFFFVFPKDSDPFYISFFVPRKKGRWHTDGSLKQVMCCAIFYDMSAIFFSSLFFPCPLHL